MGAPDWQPDTETAAAIAAARTPEDRDAVAQMFDLLFTARDGGGGGTQGVLPLETIAATGLPISLVWGTEDPVTPFAQGAEAPPGFALTALAGHGHMLMLEAEDACESAILASIEQVDGA